MRFCRLCVPAVTLVLALLHSPPLACAQFVSGPPRAIIQGPNAAIPGEMIVLDASTSEGAERFLWTITPELKGRKQLLPLGDDGRRCQVASYGGRYVVTLAVSNANGIDMLRWELNISGQAPCPPPQPPGPVDPVPDDTTPPKPQPPKPVDPIPPDPPQPPKPEPVPAGEYGIAPKVAEIINGIPDANRAATAKVLADRVEALAAEVAAGTVTSAQVVLTRIGTALRDLPPAWVAGAPQFSAALQLVYEQNKAGKLGLTTLGGFKTPGAWATLLRECAGGARAVK